MEAMEAEGTMRSIGAMVAMVVMVVMGVMGPNVALVAMGPMGAMAWMGWIAKDPDIDRKRNIPSEKIHRHEPNRKHSIM